MSRGVRAALGLAALVACRRGDPAGETLPGATGSAVAAPASAVPADHLAPGELVAGPESTFGIPLPRGVHVERTAPDAARALGQVALHPFAKYLRARLGPDARVTEGDAFATFEQVKLPSKPGRLFRFRLTQMPAFQTLLEVDDLTPPPAAPIPTSDELRWKAAGLTPQGHLLDPSHTE